MSTVVRKLERNTPSFKLNVRTFIVAFVIVATVSVLMSHPQVTWWNYYLTIAWSVYFPIGIAGFVGAILSRRHRPSQFQGIVQQKVIFIIPTVGRQDTVPALERVINSVLQNSPNNLVNYRIDIIVDEGSEAISYLKEKFESPRVQILVVPKSYRTQNGAKHKGRANQYALEVRRLAGENTPDMVIYHLDDDTGVRADTISSIAEFASSSKYDLAQGVLTFPHDLCPSWFCRMADSVRPSDDLSRFYLFTGALHTPLVGLHGEHLLVRASVEDEIGWDKLSKVEDAYFALKFSGKFPGKSTFLPSMVYGASPESVSSLVRQRKRWVTGLINLLFDSSLPFRTRIFLGYSILNWSFGWAQHVLVALLLAYLLGIYNTSPIIGPVVVVWAFNLAYQVWMYIEGLKINLQVSGIHDWTTHLSLSILTLPFFFVFSLVEATAALLGLIGFISGDDSFDVISKRR